MVRRSEARLRSQSRTTPTEVGRQGPRMNEPVVLLNLSVFLFSPRSQVLVEPVQRALPCELGRGFVVTGRRVVVEAVISTLVDIALVRHVCGRECGIKGWPA